MRADSCPFSCTFFAFPMLLCEAACMSVRVCGLTPEPFHRTACFEASPSNPPLSVRLLSFRFVSFRFASRSSSTSQSDGKLFNCFSCSTPTACGRPLFAASYLLEAFHLPIFSQCKSALHENDNNSNGTGTQAVEEAEAASQAPKAASWL